MTGIVREERIGGHRLILGDCLAVMPGLGKVDAVVTDPPYGIGFASQPTRYQRANGMVGVNWDGFAPHDAVASAIKIGDAAIVWGGNYFALPISRGWLAWIKTGNAPSMADMEMAWTSMDMNSRIFKKTVKSASMEKNLQSAAHPTQKPIALMQWCLGFLPDAKTVLDPFMGSGTTGVACQRLGRQFIGIEIDPIYWALACKRVDEATRQPDLFIKPAEPRQVQEGWAL